MNLADGLALAVGHFMPGLMTLLAAVPDPRDPKLVWYPSKLLLAQGLMMPLINVPSRRQFDSVCLDENFRKNLAAMLGRDIPSLASAPTVNHLMERLDPSQMEGMLPELLNHLIRMRALDRFRFEGEFLVAIDGTELMRWLNRRHCDLCLVAEHQDGRNDFFHQVVDAKLVSFSGLSFSFGFEFIENVGGRYEKL